jgi:uncharacterized protein
MAEVADVLASYVGREVEVQHGPDTVNAAMIRHWCEAMGDENPTYLDQSLAAASVHGGIVAPPTMLQAWVMRNTSKDVGRQDNPFGHLLDYLDSIGFTSVVGTNSEQTYERYLRPGDRVMMRTTIDDVSPEKTTGLGTGHFVTTLQSYFDADDELVGTMRFRIFKFRPTPKVAAPAPAAAIPAAAIPAGTEHAVTPRVKRPRPATTEDGDFFFAGAKAKQLLVQGCDDCGSLQHPPHAACRRCQSFNLVPKEMSGRGEIYSFVVTHYPQVPSFDYPLAVALVQLDEGPRVVANIVDADPATLVIGQRLEVTFIEHDDELTLPAFRVVSV